VQEVRDEKSIGGREGNGTEMSVGEDEVLTASVRDFKFSRRRV
jgi:hypothetical protein